MAVVSLRRREKSRIFQRLADVERYGTQIDLEERSLELGEKIKETRNLIGRDDVEYQRPPLRPPP